MTRVAVHPEPSASALPLAVSAPRHTPACRGRNLSRVPIWRTAEPSIITSVACDGPPAFLDLDHEDGRLTVKMAPANLPGKAVVARPWSMEPALACAIQLTGPAGVVLSSPVSGGLVPAFPCWLGASFRAVARPRCPPPIPDAAHLRPFQTSKPLLEMDATDALVAVAA